MKKIVTFILVMVCALGCALTLSACEDKKYAGTYEMIDISGTIVMNGQTTYLSTEMYEYYRITLKRSGKAIVESKGRDNGLEYRNEGEWEEEDGKIELRTKSSGITVTEVLDWKDGVITYNANQYSSGISMNVTIILKK